MEELQVGGGQTRQTFGDLVSLTTPHYTPSTKNFLEVAFFFKSFNKLYIIDMEFENGRLFINRKFY